MPQAQRYSRILQSAKYYSAIDNYIKYVTDSTKRSAASKIGQGDPRPPSQKLYIDPFSIPLATNQVVEASAGEPAWTAYRTHIGNRATATKPAEEAFIIPVANYAPPRVKVVTGRRTTGTKEISKVTGLPYSNYGGKSVSVPFGRNGAGDTVVTAFAEIEAAIRLATPGVLVSLIRERV
jgi:hypothetical protein